MRHWKVGVGVPEAPTEKEVAVPVHGETLAGLDVIEGETLTVRAAALVVALPQVLVTTQS